MNVGEYWRLIGFKGEEMVIQVRSDKYSRYHKASPIERDVIDVAGRVVEKKGVDKTISMVRLRWRRRLILTNDFASTQWGPHLQSKTPWKSCTKIVGKEEARFKLMDEL